VLSEVFDPLNYFVSPRWYLARAKLQLEKPDAASLFYVAFELRAAVEARQLEYATALEHLEGTKIRHWNLSETHKRLRFNSFVSAIAYMRFEQGERALDLYHVPISEKLKNETEKLGDLLHAQAQYRPPSDPYWARLRVRLSKLYRAVWTVCQGNCLVPPLLDSKGNVHPIRIEWAVVDVDPMQGFDFSSGAQFTAKIKYLDEPPSEWVCDL